MQPGALYLKGLAHIKEPRLLADLSEIGLSEGLLNDDVKKSVNHGVVLALESGQVLARDKSLRLGIDNDVVLDASEVSLNQERVVNVRGAID